MDDIVENTSLQFSQDSDISVKNDEKRSEKIERPPKYFQQTGNLRSIQEISKKYRDIFNFPYFNIIQSKVMDDVLYTDNSTVISAPTGSGKTVIFELAIIRLLMQAEDREIDNNFKVIYIAPVKALCTERMQDWHSKFSKFGINSMIMTSDTDNFDYQNFEKFSIILTTPEKWDSVTRRWRESINFVGNIKLMMIDEVHLLNEEGRGAILEVIVTRMKIIRNLINKNKDIKNFVRFMAVSATIPNIEDIAEWLGSQKEPAICYTISEDLRPVKLNKVVKGYSCTPNTPPFKFDMTLTYKLKDIILEYSCGKPILIFCATRKSVEMTSNYLSQNLTFHLSPEQKKILIQAASQLVDNKMKTILAFGVGSHHAGMPTENRTIVENLFRDGNLPVLVTTSTLSMGVNLPANLVIIKSTMQYAGNEYKEYTESALLQMIGRAGRPQFDTSATAVIMTSALTKARYEKMIGGNELIESNLHNHLKEHLNSEIALATITDFYEALSWLQMTFLYIRAQKNPKYYKIPQHLTKDKIEKRFLELCQIEMNDLAQYGMIEQDFYTGIQPTNVGILMSKYYMNFETIKVFKEVKGNENLEQMVLIISKCNEFAEIFLRKNDKGTLNSLNKCKDGPSIRFPLKGRIQTIAMKVNCMIQAVFGNLKIPNVSLSLESSKIMQIGERVSKCLVEYLEKRNTCFSSLLNAIILSKCFRARMWENSRLIATQLHGIGPVLATMLEVAGKVTFKSIMESDPRELEMIMNRKPPLGNEIIEAVHHIPSYQLQLLQTDFNEISKIEIKVILQNNEKIREKCTIQGGNFMSLVVGNNKNDTLLYTKISHNKMSYEKECKKVLEFDFVDNCIVKAFLISENWVGIDCDATIELEKYDSVGLSAAQHKNMVNANISGKITRKVIGNAIKTPKTLDKNKNKLILNYFQQNPTRRVTFDSKQNKFIEFNQNSSALSLSLNLPESNNNIPETSTTVQESFVNDLNVDNDIFSNVDPDKLTPEKQNFDLKNNEQSISLTKPNTNDSISKTKINKFNFNKCVPSNFVTLGCLRKENLIQPKQNESATNLKNFKNVRFADVESYLSNSVDVPKQSNSKTIEIAYEDKDLNQKNQNIDIVSSTSFSNLDKKDAFNSIPSILSFKDLAKDLKKPNNNDDSNKSFTPEQIKTFKLKQTVIFSQNKKAETYIPPRNYSDTNESSPNIVQKVSFSTVSPKTMNNFKVLNQNESEKSNNKVNFTKSKLGLLTMPQESSYNYPREIVNNKKVIPSMITFRKSPVSTEELKNILENASIRQRQKIESSQKFNTSSENIENEFVNKDLFGIDEIENLENITCEPDILQNEKDIFENQNYQNESQSCCANINFQNNFFTQNTTNNIFGDNYQNNNYNNFQANINCENSFMLPASSYENLDENYNAHYDLDNAFYKQDTIERYTLYDYAKGTQKEPYESSPPKKPKLSSTLDVLKIFEFKKKKIMPPLSENGVSNFRKEYAVKEILNPNNFSSQPTRSNFIENDRPYIREQSQNYLKRWSNPIRHYSNFESNPQNVYSLENRERDEFPNLWWVPHIQVNDDTFSRGYRSCFSQPFGLIPSMIPSYNYDMSPFEINRFGLQEPQHFYRPNYNQTQENEIMINPNLYQNDIDIQTWMGQSQVETEDCYDRSSNRNQPNHDDSYIKNLQSLENWSNSKNLNKNNIFGSQKQVLGNYVTEIRGGVNNNFSGVHVSRTPNNKNFDKNEFLEKLKKINETKFKNSDNLILQENKKENKKIKENDAFAKFLKENLFVSPDKYDKKYVNFDIGENELLLSFYCDSD